MNFVGKIIFIGSLIMMFSAPAFGVTVSWTDWQSNTSDSALGELMVGSDVVTVSYANTANHAFVQTGSGTDYWREDVPAPYTSGNVDNAPTAAEQIALYAGGTVTINFSETISDVYIAMNSWNGNTVDFLGTSIIVDSFGDGYWGTTGTAVLNNDSTGFYGSGEFHGVIFLSGDFDSISFTHTTENWHGFTIGVAGLADPPSVPVPAAFVLFASGLLGLIGLKRTRVNKA